MQPGFKLKKFFLMIAPKQNLRTGAHRLGVVGKSDRPIKKG